MRAVFATNEKWCGLRFVSNSAHIVRISVRVDIGYG